MLARHLLARRLRHSRPALSLTHARYLTQNASPPPSPSTSASSDVTSQNSTPAPQTPPNQPAKRQRTWLAGYLDEHPTAKKVFVAFGSAMGYGNKKQVAGRRAFNMYSHLCIPKPDEDRAFWQNECDLPPTFQSWFTVMNLHVWLLTVRLRALPAPQGLNHIQGLIDHFFLDVEDRIRRVLQPAGPDSMLPAQNLMPYTPPTDFYTIANSGMKVVARGRAPERLVSMQMKVFREQWAGLGVACDLGLVTGDAELAAAVWRNFLGARGARGIVYQSDADSTQPHFRRSVNLLGGTVEQGGKMTPEQLRAEEAKDDGSGVHDYTPAEADKYVAYPELMAALVAYIRRELKRLEAIPDELILGPGKVGTESLHMEQLRFGRVRDGNPLLKPLQKDSRR